MMNPEIEKKLKVFLDETKNIRDDNDIITWKSRVSAFLEIVLSKQDVDFFLHSSWNAASNQFPELKRNLQVLIEKIEAEKLRDNIETKNVTLEKSRVTEREEYEVVNKSQLPTARHEKQFVFIVHGHDNEMKETVARFSENLGLQSVVLHEQPNSGKTIIEKFETFADKVSYAVVLLSPDDLGTSVKSKNAKYRARQNVIFELGFFVAKLGRDKVSALCKNDIELPSDYHGVVYIAFDDSGAWRIALAKEMKNAGLKINIDKII